MIDRARRATLAQPATRLEALIHDLIGGSRTRAFDAHQIAAALEGGELPVARMARLEAACRHALNFVSFIDSVTPAETLARLGRLRQELSDALNEGCQGMGPSGCAGPYHLSQRRIRMMQETIAVPERPNDVLRRQLAAAASQVQQLREQRERLREQKEQLWWGLVDVYRLVFEGKEDEAMAHIDRVLNSVGHGAGGEQAVQHVA